MQDIPPVSHHMLHYTALPTWLGQTICETLPAICQSVGRGAALPLWRLECSIITAQYLSPGWLLLKSQKNVHGNWIEAQMQFVAAYGSCWSVVSAGNVLPVERNVA